MLICTQATSKEQSIRIASSGGLSEDQIQNMVREAEANAEKDKAVSHKGLAQGFGTLTGVCAVCCMVFGS